VLPVKVDTAKQKLYGIKPIFEVRNKTAFWGVMKWALVGIIIVGAIIWYCFIFRKKRAYGGRKKLLHFHLMNKPKSH